MTVWRVQAREGKVTFGTDYNQARFREWCKENDGKWLRIEDEKPLRSMSQHKFYWVYLTAISNETGHTPEELHSWAKKKFLPHKFTTVMGEDVELSPTTTTLSKAEFSYYMERICAETGVPIPSPEEAGYLPH